MAEYDAAFAVIFPPIVYVSLSGFGNPLREGVPAYMCHTGQPSLAGMRVHGSTSRVLCCPAVARRHVVGHMCVLLILVPVSQPTASQLPTVDIRLS